MLKRFFPKQPNFFNELSEMSKICIEASKALSGLAEQNPQVEQIAQQIRDLEKNADARFRTSLQLLTDTFITPIEREHLHSLFLAADDVVDSIHAVAQSVVTYRMQSFAPGTRELFALAYECCKQLGELISRIDEIKAPSELHRVSREINKTGSKVESTVRATLASLYDSQAPIGAILKERDLILMIQGVTNSAEKVTTIMEEVMLDQA